MLVLACVLDLARTPRPDRLLVRRRSPERAGLGQDFARSVRIEADPVPGAAGLVLELDEEFAPAFDVRARTLLGDPARGGPAGHAGAGRDSARGAGPRIETASPRDRAGGGARVVENGARRRALPPGLAAPAAGDPSGGPDRVRLPQSGPIDLVRVYRSRLRGAHALGDLRLRLRGPLGLFERSARLAGSQTIAIEPALLGLSRTLQLAASERWRDLGVRNLLRRGGLFEFESLREHVAGDDLRLVDWKAFAKRGRPIVRQFREERGQELVIAFDCGRRMSAATAEDEGPGEGTEGWTKLDHALDAGLQIAAVALQQGDRVGCLAFDDGLRAWIPPARGAAQLDRLRRGVFALRPSRAEADLERALRELALRHERRALVLILSDVADPLSIERQRAALAAASRRHRILFAGLDDPSLRVAARGGPGVDPRVRAEAHVLLLERAASLRRLAGTGVRVLDTLPAEAAAPLLAAWLAARRGL